MAESYSLKVDRWPAAGRILDRWKRLPRTLRLGALTACALLSAVAAYAFFFSPSSTLNLVCRHNLRSAELSVLIDGEAVHSEQILGTAKKRFGLLDTRIEGSYSKSLAVAAGRHTVQVRLRSETDGFEQTRTINVNLVAGKDATVLVTTQRGGMALAYQGPPAGASGEMATGYFNSLRALLVTVFGSAASAAIAFVVQEALRSRKTPRPAQSQSS